MTDTKLPSFTPLVESLPSTIPFVGPEAIERRRNETFKVRVGANESAFGVSPKAAAAMRDAVENIAWYGDPEGYDLRTAIAAHHGVEMDEVCLGGGIDELLGLTVRMLAQPGAPVLTSLGAYPTFNYHVAGFGAELIRAIQERSLIWTHCWRPSSTNPCWCSLLILTTRWALGMMPTLSKPLWTSCLKRLCLSMTRLT